MAAAMAEDKQKLISQEEPEESEEQGDVSFRTSDIAATSTPQSLKQTANSRRSKAVYNTNASKVPAENGCVDDPEIASKTGENGDLQVNVVSEVDKDGIQSESHECSRTESALVEQLTENSAGQNHSGNDGVIEGEYATGASVQTVAVQAVSADMQNGQDGHTVAAASGPATSANTASCDPLPSLICDARVLNNDEVQVPITGYEIMEQRARFTVFKLQVKRGRKDTWFIFRRYTDFFRLNEQLSKIFPHYRLALPPKKWFGDNFDTDFIEDRMLGLQAFVNNVIGNSEVASSAPVREFFCLDEPPGDHESIEESRALCQSLEEEIYSLRRQLKDRDATINLLKDEVLLRKKEVENLQKALRLECNQYTRSHVCRGQMDHVLNLALLNFIERAMNNDARQKLSSPTVSEISLPETDQDAASGACAAPSTVSFVKKKAEEEMVKPDALSSKASFADSNCTAAEVH